MHMDRKIVAQVMAMTILCVGTAQGQESGEVGVGEIQQTNPGFLVRIEIDRKSRDYREGDNLAVKVVSEIDAYVYVVYQQADGKTFQIFPNSKQPDNRLKARQAVQIPGDDDLFRWKIGPPFGKEMLKVIATEHPITSLSEPALRAKRFNPISAKELKGVALELGAIGNDLITAVDPVSSSGPGRWTECEVELTTYPANQELIASGAKRYGVFFGVSQHKFAFFEEAVSGHSPNLATPHRDARSLDVVLRDIGGMNQTKLFTNEEATRKNLEQAITQWLPSVSRPGDTVVIYYSGHGGQIPDDNGDEADMLDEFLVPYDYMGPAAVAGIVKQAKEGTLPPEFAAYVPLAKDLFQKVGGSLEKLSEVLTRQTCVSDDLFGHWLQMLDDRQVIVVLDICYSGGFATNEKDLKPQANTPLKNKAFDFLDQEISRLKDIGQTGSVLFTASSTKEVSLVRSEADLSVMTFYLIESLERTKGPLEINQAYQDCLSGMRGYFESERFHSNNARRRA
ncbi:MAG: DUF4384 domain-containing protein, partial [Pirellulaceae bacterium]|nr:DUF4384 domain-containing protein [Pirellulaceae bacterium]